MTLTHRERLERCLSNADLDRPPVALWRHFPVDDQAPDGLAVIKSTHGRRFILGTGCVTPITAPHGNLLRARNVVEAR